MFNLLLLGQENFSAQTLIVLGSNDGWAAGRAFKLKHLQKKFVFLLGWINNTDHHRGHLLKIESQFFALPNTSAYLMLNHSVAKRWWHQSWFWPFLQCLKGSLCTFFTANCKQRVKRRESCSQQSWSSALCSSSHSCGRSSLFPVQKEAPKDCPQLSGIEVPSVSSYALTNHFSRDHHSHQERTNFIHIFNF